MHQVKTIRGKKRKHNLFLHTLAMPGLALSSVFPVWWHCPPVRSNWVLHSLGPPPSLCCSGTALCPVGTQLGRGTSKHQHTWQGSQAARGTLSSPQPQGSVPYGEGGMVGEHMGLHWLVPLPPSAPQTSQPQELKRSFGTSMGRKLVRKVSVTTGFIIITYLCPPPR